MVYFTIIPSDQVGPSSITDSISNGGLLDIYPKINELFEVYMGLYGIIILEGKAVHFSSVYDYQFFTTSRLVLSLRSIFIGVLVRG